MQFEGKVVKKVFSPGSDSEHLGIFLITDNEKEYLIRRANAHAFHDPELEKLVGKRITCTGKVSTYVLFISQWKVIG